MERRKEPGRRGEVTCRGVKCRTGAEGRGKREQGGREGGGEGRGGRRKERDRGRWEKGKRRDAKTEGGKQIAKILRRTDTDNRRKE